MSGNHIEKILGEKEMIKKIYSEFWGGMIEITIVKFTDLPKKARYKYTDEDRNLDIYIYENINQGTESFFGVEC